ncbi:MAG TPA: hypothetical protein VEU30_02110 [Thermoanaerobaculia bacterium]|nr:hypothetical protein [Thermoanaerobaculia bacterium]
MVETKPLPRPIAFINIPYARTYETVYFSLIAGAAGHGLVPTAAVHDPSSRFQLDRIYDLIAAAQYSFHDLSWMSLDRKAPRTPRLNMAFELGLAVALSRTPGVKHEWFVLDTVAYRLDKALSDLGGIRPRIHDRSPESVLRAVMNALGRQRHQPTLGNLLEVYTAVADMARQIKSAYSTDLFETRPFKDLVFIAHQAARASIPSLAAEDAE